MNILERYRDEVSVHKDGSRWEVIRINRLLSELGGKITPEKLRLWRDKRLKKVKPTSVNRELNVISAAYTHAIREWGIQVLNPVRLIVRPKNGRGRKRRISQHEFSEITGADWHGRQARYIPKMFEFAIETGMRLGEITALRWDETYADYVHISKSKNGDERDVPLSKRAQEILAGLPRGERVFPVNKESVGAQFRKKLKELGVVNMHFHDTRHEAASRLSKFLTVLELAAVLGHRDLQSLMVYYNPTASELSAKMK